jgi:hypothetical protein
LPVVAISLISASRVPGTARRVEGSRRGLSTLRAGSAYRLIYEMLPSKGKITKARN